MNQKGFTIIELIAVLCMIGVFAAFAVPKFIHIDSTADKQALSIGVETLNKQEKFQWSEYKLSTERYPDDEADFIISARVDTNLGFKYKWNGKTLSFGTASVPLERVPATNSAPGMWGGTDKHGNKYGWMKNSNNPHN